MHDYAGTFDKHEIRDQIVKSNFGSWLLMRRHPPKQANEDGGWTGVFWVRITAADGLLRVSGDFDPIIFQGHLGFKDNPAGRVAWMGGQTFLSSYVCEKARMGSGRDACTAWDVDKAHEDLRELIRERETQLADEARATYGDDPNDWPDDEMCCSSLLAMQEGLDEHLVCSGREGVHEIHMAIYMSNHEIEMETIQDVGTRPSQALQLAHLAVQRLHMLLTPTDSASHQSPSDEDATQS